MTSCGQSGEVQPRDGEAVCFEELAQSARPALVRVAQAVTGCREDAEDAVQSSLLKAMGAWPRVAGQEQWRQHAYVRQIVINTCRSGWRKWGSRVLVGDMPEVVQAPATEASDNRALVRQALQRLPARQREVLLLRYYDDLSEAEIANRLGCAPGTVKSAAARALRALRLMLPEFDPNGTAGARAESAQSSLQPAAAYKAGPVPLADDELKSA